MLYIILKEAWRVEGAIVPLFNSLPVFNARVLRIGAFKEWALLIIALVCLEVDFIIVLGEVIAAMDEEAKRQLKETTDVAELRGRGRKKVLGRKWPNEVGWTTEREDATRKEEGEWEE